MHVTGSGEDPHLQGFVDIKGGAFGVPAGGVSYTRPQHADRSRARQGAAAEVRDSRRARRAAERLRRARRARAPGRRRQHRDRLRQLRGDRQRARRRRHRQHAHDHRRAAPAADSRHHPARGGAPRSRPDPAAVLRPVCGRGAAAGGFRRAHRRGQRQRAGSDRRRAAASGDHGRRCPAHGRRPRQGAMPAPGGAFAPVELDLRLHDPGQPRAARQEAAAGRARPARRSAT